MMDTPDVYPWCRRHANGGCFAGARRHQPFKPLHVVEEVGLDSEGSAGWVQRRIINFEKLLPINNPRIRPNASMIGFAEVLGVIFVGTDVGVFVMDLKSGRKRKVGELHRCLISKLMEGYLIRW
jgi:hypothetical protein